MKGKSLNRVRLLAIPWTAAYQAPPSMGFSKQEYWSGVPSPSQEVRHREWQYPSLVVGESQAPVGLMGSWCQIGGVSWQERRLGGFVKASILRAFCISVFIRSCHGKSHCRVLSMDVA